MIPATSFFASASMDDLISLSCLIDGGEGGGWGEMGGGDTLFLNFFPTLGAH